MPTISATRLNRSRSRNPLRHQLALLLMVPDWPVPTSVYMYHVPPTFVAMMTEKSCEDTYPESDGEMSYDSQATDLEIDKREL